MSTVNARYAAKHTSGLMCHAACLQEALKICARDGTGKLLGKQEARAAQAKLEGTLKEQSASSSSPSGVDIAEAADTTDKKAALLGGKPCGPGSLFEMLALCAAGGAVLQGEDPYQEGVKEFGKYVHTSCRPVHNCAPNVVGLLWLHLNAISYTQRTWGPDL